MPVAPRDRKSNLGRTSGPSGWAKGGVHVTYNLHPKLSPSHPPKYNLKHAYFQSCKGITNIS